MGFHVFEHIRAIGAIRVGIGVGAGVETTVGEPVGARAGLVGMAAVVGISVFALVGRAT